MLYRVYEILSRYHKNKPPPPSPEELFQQAVQNVVFSVILEDHNNKRAMQQNTKLPFPCYCKAMCSYSVYLKSTITAFDKLYLEYVAVHRDFTDIFNATWTKLVIREECKKGKLETVQRLMLSHSQPPPEESELPKILDINKIPLTPAEAFIYDEKTSSIILDRNRAEEEEDTRMKIIRKRLTLELEKPSFWYRMWSYIYAYKECLCLNCVYRDCVYDYRRAIRKLKNEYELLYRKYEVLFGATDMLPPEGNKKIVMLSGAQYEIEAEINRYVEKSGKSNFINNVNA